MKNTGLTFDEYQRQARVTANDKGTMEKKLTNWALGLTGEAGEVADLIKKFVFHGHELDVEELRKELGDTLWYIAQLAYEIDVWLSSVAGENIEKLRGRYPEGFDKEKSINRKEYINND